MCYIGVVVGKSFFFFLILEIKLLKLKIFCHSYIRSILQINYFNDIYKALESIIDHF